MIVKSPGFRNDQLSIGLPPQLGPSHSLSPGSLEGVLSEELTVSRRPVAPAGFEPATFGTGGTDALTN